MNAIKKPDLKDLKCPPKEKELSKIFFAEQILLNNCLKKKK